MAVHKRGYRQYNGPLTPERWRFWILTRYAFKHVFRSRMLAIFYALCFIPSIGAMTMVYLSHNLDVLQSLFQAANFRSDIDIFPVSANLFLGLMSFQATLSVLVTVLIGPGLISPDLTNNALPLYLSRPFSRAEYVFGKFSVLFVLLSCITAAPMLMIYLLKSVLSGPRWFIDNIHLAFAVGVGCVVWVILISLIALASSAWVRWKPAAAGMIFALFFFPAGFGQAANLLMRMTWGSLLNGIVIIGTAWNSLFFINDSEGYAAAARNLNPVPRDIPPIPAWSAWLMIVAVCGLSVYMLNRKIRAHEVVR